jgi:hypothetical protein
MSTMGRDADNNARKVRQIRTDAERAAHQRLAAYNTTVGIILKRGGHTIRLSHDEAEILARDILDAGGAK